MSKIKSVFKKVDIHIHYFNYEGYLEKLLAACKKVGIDKLCLSTSGWIYNHVSNDKIKEAFTKYPDKIYGFGYFDLGKNNPENVRILKEEGFKGLKMINPPENYDHKSFYPIYAEIEKQRMPILFHTGIVYRTPHDKEMDVSSNRMRPIYLDTIARAFPELKIVGAHLGTPWLTEACMVARTNPNVYFDITGSPDGGWRSLITPQDMHRLFYWEGAFEKIVFGTDVLYEDLEKAVAWYDRLLGPVNLSEKTMAKIFGETVESFIY